MLQLLFAMAFQAAAGPVPDITEADWSPNVTCTPITHYRGERHFDCTFGGTVHRRCAEDIVMHGRVDINCLPEVEARVVHTDLERSEQGPARPDFVCGPNPNRHDVQMLCRMGSHGFRCKREVTHDFNSLYCEPLAWEMSRTVDARNFTDRGARAGQGIPW